MGIRRFRNGRGVCARGNYTREMPGWHTTYSTTVLRRWGVIDHVSIQVDDLEVASTFYDVVLAPLGYRRLREYPGVLAFGDEFPSFWLGAATDTIPNRPSHLAFRAPSREAVAAFFDAALAGGATPLHEPRLWPEYHLGYFGAFVRDPDGNNVEAVHHTFG